MAVMSSKLSIANTPSKLYQSIVDAPFSDKVTATNIDLGIGVLLQVDPISKTIDRVALSNTELAQGAVLVSAKPFHQIKIPLHTKNNYISEAIVSGRHKITEDWQYLFNPALKPEEARRNQAGASIESSLVWPLKANHGGALIFSFYQPRRNIGSDHLEFARMYAQLVDRQLGSISSK